MWRRRANFLLRLGTIGVPLTALAASTVAPGHDIAVIGTCFLLPFGLGMALDAWHTKNRPLNPTEQDHLLSLVARAAAHGLDEQLCAHMEHRIEENTSPFMQWNSIEGLLEQVAQTHTIAIAQKGGPGDGWRAGQKGARAETVISATTPVLWRPLLADA